MPHLDAGHYSAIMLAGGKAFIMMAETIPAPPANCGFWRRWSYDFLQVAASNSSKVGAVKP